MVTKLSKNLKVKSQNFKNKRILITAGPTWVAIDKVRVISNIATGETGILLAEKLSESGAKVTLILGPVGEASLDKNIRIIRFKLFDELKNIIREELKSKKYDVMIHSAAASDYKPLKVYPRKVKSGMKNWRISLAPAEKIIDSIRKLGGTLFLIGFKFEPRAKKGMLIKQAKGLMRRADLDLAVANTNDKSRYAAYIIGKKEIYGAAFNKEAMVKKLISVINEKI